MYKLTKVDMEESLKSPKSKKKAWYKKGKTITVNNRMQKNYSYKLTYNAGTNITNGGVDVNGNLIKYLNFNPKHSPGKMLQMGVFRVSIVMIRYSSFLENGISLVS